MAVSKILERTFINRREGKAALAASVGHLVTDYTIKTAPQAWKTWKGDPVILLDNPVSIRVYVKAHKKKGVMVPGHRRSMRFIGAPLFSKTTKMGAGSMSLPAGPPHQTGGTCIGSALADDYDDWLKIPGVKADAPGGRLEDQICQKCYSNKGNYMHRNTQYAQVIRHRWLEEMLKKGIEPTAEAFIDAIDRHSRNEKQRDKAKEDPRFFRIHDSGDLLNIEYWNVWKLVCEHFRDDILFWMPTRSWWCPRMSLNWKGVPDNLAFRPSGYHFDDHAPEVPGMSAGTTGHYWSKTRRTDPVASGLADWPCPAYAGGKSGGKCIGALERARHEWKTEHPNWLAVLEQIVDGMDDVERELTDGGRDCRVCWINKDVSVSYKAH